MVEGLLTGLSEVFTVLLGSACTGAALEIASKATVKNFLGSRSIEEKFAVLRSETTSCLDLGRKEKALLFKGKVSKTATEQSKHMHTTNDDDICKATTIIDGRKIKKI